MPFSFRKVAKPVAKALPVPGLEEAVDAVAPPPPLDITAPLLAALRDPEVRAEFRKAVIDALEEYQDATAVPPHPQGTAPAASIESLQGETPPIGYENIQLYDYDLLDRMEFLEGKRNTPYQDSKGIWHCGIGHNLESNHPHEYRQMIGRTFSDRQIEDWLEEDLEDALGRVKTTCRIRQVDWDTLPEKVQEALVNMAFQLGNTRGWTNMWGYIRNRNFGEAAQEALRSGEVEGKASQWLYDTPRRAVSVAHYLSNRTLRFHLGPVNQWGPTWSATPVA